MQPKPTLTMDPQERLDAVVTAYLKAVEAGQKPDRQRWLTAYPDVAKELAEFFADEDRMVRMAGPLRAPVNQGTPRPPANKALSIPAAIPVGRFGDYELQAEIARGGMGVVYKARQISVNRVVALKMILGGAVASLADVQRFQTEAEAAAHLEHPNIIPIYDVGSNDGQHFFTMKLIEGGSLAERLPCTAADRKSIIAMLSRVCRAVHFAHQRGILHRDLKPANVLINADSQSVGGTGSRSASALAAAHGPTPVVTDFGLAKLVERGSEITRSGAIVGTPSYMAPEQAKGQHKTITTAADVYSLGVMLYEVLTGRVPFKGETPLDTVLQVLERDPTPPRQLNRRIDADIETICLKCLEKEPGRRYESAGALADELDRWLAGESIQARPSGVVRQAWKLARRRRVPAAFAALILLSAISAPMAWIKMGEANHLFAAEATAKAEAQDKAKAAAVARTLAEHEKDEAEKARQRAEAAEKVAQRQTYYARIGQADGQLRFHNILRARELLERCPQDMRQWEWDYLNRQCQLDLHTWKPHGGASLLWSAFSADGQRVASLGWDNKVCVWDPNTGRPTWSHAAHGSWGACAAQGPDHLLAFPNVERTAGIVEVWDTQKNRHVITLHGHQLPVTGIAFSPDGKWLATTAHDAYMSHFEMKIWDAATGRAQHSFADGSPWCVAFNPDGERVAVGHTDGTLKLLDAATGEVKFSTRGHKAIIHGLTFRPSSKVLATASVDEIKLWDTETGKETGALTKQNGNIFTIAFSRDGKRMATPACDMTVRVWDADTLEELFALGGHTKPVMSVGFNPVDDRLVSVSSDGTARLWSTRTSKDSIDFHDEAGFRSAVFTPDGKRVATSSSLNTTGEAKVWDVASGKVLQTFKGVVSNAVLSPDGLRLAAGMAPSASLGLGGMKMMSTDYTVKVWDVATGQELLALKDHAATPALVAFSADGQRLASVCNFGTAQTRTGQAEIKVWDLANGKPLVTWRSPVIAGLGTALAFSPDGKHLAGASADHTSLVWDAGTGQLLFTSPKHKDAVDAVAFSPNGKQLAESYGLFEERPQIALWDLGAKKQVMTLKGHFSMIFGLAFSPDGKRLASTSYDRTVKIWDPVEGEELLTLHGHTGHVYSAAFSPDGRRLMSASDDKTFRIWDATPAATATAKK